MGRVRHPRPDPGPGAAERRAADVRQHGPAGPGGRRRARRRRGRAAPRGAAGDHGRGLPPRRQRRHRGVHAQSATASAAASLGQKLADIFAGGGGVKYYLMAGDGGESSPSTSGLDVGAVPGSSVISARRRQGHRQSRSYSILGRYNDVEIDIRLADDPSLLLLVTHIAKPKVADRRRGAARHDDARAPCAASRAALDQALSQYTSDNGDHVQLVMLRVTRPELGGPSERPRRPRGDARRHRRLRFPGRRLPRRPAPGRARPRDRPGLRDAVGRQPAVHALRARRAAGAALQDARLAQGRLARPGLTAGLQRAASRRRQADPLGRRRRQPEPPARPGRPRRGRRLRRHDDRPRPLRRGRRRPPAHHARPRVRARGARRS